MKHINLRITGKVQGVWFRATAKVKAEEMGLKGFIRNETDGSLYAEAEGNADKLFQFTMWCHYGPAGARVREVTVEDAPLVNFEDFRIDK